MAQQSRGVQVDRDARRLGDPVTVVVWPSGNEQDADTWSDATNYLAMGAGIKSGYPTEPQQELNPDSDPAPGNAPAPEPRQAPAAARPAPTSSSATSPSP